MYSKASNLRNSAVESAIELQCLCVEMERQATAARFLARKICATLEGLESESPDPLKPSRAKAA